MKKISDKKTWNSIIEKEFKEDDDIYFRYEYFKLWGDEYDMTPEALYWEDGINKVFWPHLIIHNKEKHFNIEEFDFTTPYGYSGFLSNSPIEKFMKEYKRMYNNKDEFIRFHHLNQNWKYFKDAKKVYDIVVVDLDNIQIKKGHRYNIKKAMERDCEYRIIEDPTEEDIENFIQLYYLTMNINRANERYYFSYSFIKRHFDLLDSIIIEVIFDKEVIGSSIYIKGKKSLHYHLSGRDPKYNRYYPTDLMIWGAINYGKEHNFKYLVLGGGRGENDSLYEFKKGFSDITYPFYIAKLKL
jgi:hypothetical protein